MVSDWQLYLARRELRRRRNARYDIGLRARFPPSKYGAAYHLRGTDAGKERYGATASVATAQQLANRRQDGWRGRGGFWGKALGTFLGDKVGLGGIGGKLGDMAGDWVADKAKGMLGMGAYQNRGTYVGRGAIENTAAAPADAIGNALIKPTPLQEVPSFTGTDEKVRITYREYIGDVYAPANAAFTNKSFELNPGIEKTFPWLAQIAANFDEYVFLQLMFTFRSTVADFASASGQVGQVLIATQYNTHQEPFTDKAAMMEYVGAMSCKTSESLIHGVECDPNLNAGSTSKYIRTHMVPGADLKEYDHGTLNVAVANIPPTYANVSLGELWVSYTVELRKPRFYVGRAMSVSRDVFATSGAKGADLENPFTGLLHGVANTIGCKIQSAGWRTVQIVFPNEFTGDVEIQLYIQDPAGAMGKGNANYPNLGYGGNCTSILDCWGNAVNGTWIDQQSSHDNVSVSSTIHCRVTAAQNGIPNSVTWYYGTNASQDGWCIASNRPVNFFASVTEYGARAFNLQNGNIALLDNNNIIQTLP